jgi:hypothetical protein
MSLNYDEPGNAFWYRLPPERILNYAQKCYMRISKNTDSTIF